jgi:hypothetical protein
MRGRSQWALALLRHPVAWTAAVLAIVAAAILSPFALVVPNLADTGKIEYGDMISISALVSTVMIAVFSIIPNLKAMANASRFTHYSELDNMYNTLLGKVVEQPALRKVAAAPPADGSDLAIRYDAYAYMMWNFLETLHDRCLDDANLRATWAPVIGVEFAIHAAWFRRETDGYAAQPAPKFCLQFCDFIWRAFLIGDVRGLLDLAGREWRYRSEADIRADPRIAPFHNAPAAAEVVAAQR